jgi:hypothetical protein
MNNLKPGDIYEDGSVSILIDNAKRNWIKFTRYYEATRTLGSLLLYSDDFINLLNREKHEKELPFEYLGNIYENL